MCLGKREREEERRSNTQQTLHIYVQYQNFWQRVVMALPEGISLSPIRQVSLFHSELYEKEGEYVQYTRELVYSEQRNCMEFGKRDDGE